MSAQQRLNDTRHACWFNNSLTRSFSDLSIIFGTALIAALPLVMLVCGGERLNIHESGLVEKELEVFVVPVQEVHEGVESQVHGQRFVQLQEDPQYLEVH